MIDRRPFVAPISWLTVIASSRRARSYFCPRRRRSRDAPLRDARADDADTEAGPNGAGVRSSHVTSFARGGELARGGVAAIGSRRRRHDKLFSSGERRARGERLARATMYTVMLQGMATGKNDLNL